MSPLDFMIYPGQWLGLLGGGQLGRMFCMAAQSLGFKVLVLDPTENCPAGQVADQQLCADYLDPGALAEMAQRCHAVTTEFENVPAEALKFLAQHVIVNPSADAVAVAQDRIREKLFIQSVGCRVAPYCVVDDEEKLAQCTPDLFPGILKVSRLGYDGKGQAIVNNAQQLQAAFADLSKVPCILEKRLALAKEISVVVARTQQNICTVYPVAENTHCSGILDTSSIPALLSPELADQARQIAISLAQALAYVGVLCVEFFILQDGSLVVNEMAPRPHNSGHYTMDACVTSQFEQQARILAGLPLGSTLQHSSACMLNLLGDIWFDDNHIREPNWAAILGLSTAKLHLYGKNEPRVGRKMGHITFVGEVVQTQKDMQQAKTLLGISS